MTPTLRHALSKRLSQALGMTVEHLTADILTGGACQDNLKVCVHTPDERHVFVMRSDARTSLPGSLSRRSEYHVTRLAQKAGVLTPDVRWLTDDLIRPDTSTYFMPWLDGETIGARILKKPDFAQARMGLPAQLCSQLALIHSIRPTSVDPSFVALPPVESSSTRALSWMREMLDELIYPRPASEWIFQWLKANQTPISDIVLVHGDFRVGNLMVQPEGLRAILDWEFAHWGDPYEDLAWFCVRDWRFGNLQNAAGGLIPCSAWWASYESLTGQSVDPRRFMFWEVFGNLRWAVCAAIQGQRFASGGDFELLGIPRRAVEMEYEALRLIEYGPRCGGKR